MRSGQKNEFEPGDLIGKFRLGGKAPLGRGGFGEVWQAQEEIDGTTVGGACAIKLMRFEAEGTGSTQEALKATWVQEINALKSITHDSIPRTIDGGFDERTKLAFIAMELLEGETLARRIARQRLGWRRALLIAERIASALDEAHKHDVVHRDLKPQNVFLAPNDRVCVIDWGIARLGRGPAEPISMPRSSANQGTGVVVGTLDISTSEQEDLAKKQMVKHVQKNRQIVGTPGYIAPEVYEGAEPGAPVDAYALGVVLYQCLTGKLPYRLDDVNPSTGSGGSAVDAQRALAATLWEATVAGRLIPIEEFVPDLPAGVRTLVNQLLSRDPSVRGARDLAKRVAHANRFPHGVPDPPYAGLDAFGADRAGFLFGRDAHVQRIVHRLKEQRALVLSGPSGCGKSSLAVAGVAARMDRDLLEGTDGWRLLVVRPSQPKALEVVSPDGTNATEPKAAPLGTMVVVDQLEEVLTLDPERQAAFCAGLAALAATKRSKDVLVREHARMTPEMPMRVIATVREDFEWQVVRIEALRELCETSRCLVTGVDATSARELVEEPAKALGYRLGEADKAIREVEALLAKDGTALPIVQFALTEWWERRDENDKELPAKAWQELGGVEGALSYVADRHYRDLSDADQRTLRDLFGRLLLGDRKQWVSAASLKGEKEQKLMDELADLRLVKRRDEGEGRIEYELAHESLAKRWDVLKQWISERAAEDALIVDLEADARLWVRQGKPANRLRLDLVVPPAVRARLGADASAYVDASMEAKLAAERAAQAKRWKTFGGVIAGLVAVLALVAGYALQTRQNEREKSAALDEKSAALEEVKQQKAAAELAKKDADAAREKAELAEKRVQEESNKRQKAYDELKQEIAKAKSKQDLERIQKQLDAQLGRKTTEENPTGAPPPVSPTRTLKVAPPWE